MGSTPPPPIALNSHSQINEKSYSSLSGEKKFRACAVLLINILVYNGDSHTKKKYGVVTHILKVYVGIENQ